MKEFQAQTGGRYTYIDDIINLQDLALAFSSIFEGCDNFIMSGCEINGTNISEGYVYLNGKLRHFPGASSLTQFPQYIYEQNRTETVAYENGTDKLGRNVYDCGIGTRVPTVPDPITGVIPESITLTGGKRMKDAFLSRYTLLLNSSTGAQEVNGKVTFNGEINVKKAIVSNERFKVQSGNSTGQIYYDSAGNLIVQSRVGEGVTYQFIISETEGYKFLVNNEIAATFTGTLCEFKKPVTATKGTFGGIAITDSAIYNASDNTDNGSVLINMIGDNSHFRNTTIGNGKGVALIEVLGKDAKININAPLFSQDIVLKSDYLKSNTELTRMLSWQDRDGAIIAKSGFDSNADSIFRIHNSIGSLSISAQQFVDLGPAIKENGMLLSEKYVSSTTYQTDMSNKANTDDVYTIDTADKTFSLLDGGLSQFIRGNLTKEKLRGHIEATSLSEVTGKVPTLANKLSDMAKTEADKRAICTNIGATYGDDYQKKLKDSGWISLGGSLYIRQIGNIVSIQGKVTTVHSGTVFRIPNSIDPPTYAVNFSTAVSGYSTVWRCTIQGGSRDCIVKYCNNHGVTTELSITYMV